MTIPPLPGTTLTPRSDGALIVARTDEAPLTSLAEWKEWQEKGRYEGTMSREEVLFEVLEGRR